MVEKDVCEIYCYDEDKVQRVRGILQNKRDDLSRIVQVFKALSDENRAKVIYSLCQEKELCVCDVANIIGSSVATASHHLRVLRKQGLVKYRKVGKMAFYSLDDEHIRQIISIALTHRKERNVHV
ncbi:MULTISPECIES: ArsR/SmtB family transcription factor [unclassified Sporolactobacillus]|uniref:ArsR/SmtB family transcription factor n=1 Tax=unclassified Sporolactobacillus TaxID=2628533 RepID=UPI002367B5F1|nr:metalloregulator ArsR/SmtB family transcription factor [Sporolactobacillus sp. CQH2019]MDD9148579.1 metalloregulator ArsR/SmtB family transcription factor [Sporolactobacillus sp. CQH2019]